MKLLHAQVENYRSIVDSGVVKIEGRVTVLIGKNEQGKTTFLKALASSNSKSTYGPGDLPNHLRPRLEELKASEIPILTLWVSPDPTDRAVLSELNPHAESAVCFKVTKYYDGHRVIHTTSEDGTEEPFTIAPPKLDDLLSEFRHQADALSAKLAAHVARVPPFEAHLPLAISAIEQFVLARFDQTDQIDNLVKTLSTALAGVPGQDAPIQEDIAASIREIQGTQTRIQQRLGQERTQAFDAIMPQFAFHSTTLDKIPNDVVISDFVKNPEGVSKGMANLCGVAGLSMQKIQELANSNDTPMREGFEDHYRAGVSGGINEFWTQETYTVHFRFDRDKMSVSISDGTYERRIAPLERSDGFQWYLSFYAALINEVGQTRPTVFLLDNPALELHPDGQRDIKRFLEEKLPANAQVLYVTHSPAMIDPFNLEQVRQVELKGDMMGTKVGPLAFKEGSDFDLFEPVRSAIGASLASSLVFNELNVLVEGAADKPILEGAFEKLHSDYKRKILVNGSVAESKDGFLVRFYQRANLPFAVYVDADASGRKLAESLERWEVPPDKIIDLAKVAKREPGVDFELEDLISAELYHKAVLAAYPELTGEVPTGGQGKRTKIYEGIVKQQLGIGFNKRRVAEKVKILLLNEGADSRTLEGLEPLTAAIIQCLEAQTKARASSLPPAPSS